MTIGTIYQALGLTAHQETNPINQLNREVIYTVANEYLRRQSEEIRLAQAIFVEGVTEKTAERYRLTGTGTMQRSGTQGRAAASRNVGYWDVAYPIEKYDEAVAASEEAVAVMTVAEFAKQLDAIVQKNINTRRAAILYRVFNNANYQFVDELLDDAPTVTIKALANGDTDQYPPVLGAMNPATEDHYKVSGYTSANISDVNNPVQTIRRELTEHFGISSGSENAIIFANSDEIDPIEELADYRPVEDMHIRTGDDTDVPVMLPANLPGAVRGRCNNAWIVEWEWIPSGYLFGFDPAQPRPLKERIFGRGIPSGLHLHYQTSAAPIQDWQYRDYFGFGTGNRLNGVVMELTTDPTYDPPAAYA